MSQAAPQSSVVPLLVRCVACSREIPPEPLFLLAADCLSGPFCDVCAAIHGYERKPNAPGH